MQDNTIPEPVGSGIASLSKSYPNAPVSGKIGTGGVVMDEWKKDARRDVVFVDVDALFPPHCLPFFCYLCRCPCFGRLKTPRILRYPGCSVWQCAPELRPQTRESASDRTGRNVMILFKNRNRINKNPSAG